MERRVRKQGSEKNLFSRKNILAAIRSVFAYSESSFAGSGSGGTLPVSNPGLPEKACNSVVLWAFVSLPVPAALKGSKMRGRKAARVGKESFRKGAVVCEKAIGNWQLAIGLVLSLPCIDTRILKSFMSMRLP